jgi:O-antigen/teichoic acid export membrane protein
VLLVWILASRYGLIGAAAAWLPALVVSQVISAAFVRKILHRPFAGLAGPASAVVLTSGVGAAIALGVDSLLPGLPGLVLAAFLAMAIMLVLLWILNRRFDLRLADELPRAFPQFARLVGLSPLDG